MKSTNVLASFLQGRVSVMVGDITAQETDAIVNAANSSLMGGGGVDGAIHRAGGRQVLEECRRLRRRLYPAGLPTGEAVMTTGGSLKARFVIHTVGPVRGECDGRDGELLAACYRNSLALAARHSLKTVAFPSISTGAYRYPREEAAEVSSAAVADFLLRDDTLAEVRLVFFSDDDARVFLENQRFESGA
ncbi:MAG TPA: O-acetyl-ADP-ribose deacetylase [Blastocatellia bacterium]|nr:O-acetyl-ADP-ribose deacetylase [Blastocatellia bacterium]